MKKFLAILLALTLTLGLAVTAFAANKTTGDITINAPTGHTLEGRSFAAYELFTVDHTYTSGDPATTKYDYVATQLLLNVLNANKAEGAVDYTSDTAVAYVRALSTNAAMADFAATVKAYIAANSTAADATVTGAADAKSVSFADLDYGYYLIFETTTDLAEGATPMACLLDTTDATVDLKASFTTITKDVTSVDSDFGVGATVPYKIDATVPELSGSKTYSYVYTDVMTSGLTLDQNSIVITVGGTDVTAKDFVSITDKTDNGFKLTLNFLDANGAKNSTLFTTGAAIQVTYRATVNSAAVNVNGNTVTLGYGDKPTVNTISTHKDVYTYGFNISKENPGGDKLANAVFSLKNADGKYLEFTLTDGKYVFNGTVSDTLTDDAKFASDASGSVKLWGLDAATYSLIEEVAPAGYNKLTESIPVVIAANTAADAAAGSYTVNNSTNDTVTVVNQTGVELPSTGGMGTTIFTICGMLILMTSGLFLALNRKRLFNK